MINIKVALGEKQYRDFAIFDMLHRLKSWRRPVIFTAVLFLSFLVSFFLRTKSEQAAIIWTALLLFTFLVPLIYLFSFWRSIDEKCKKMKLGKAHFAYELFFEPDAEAFDVATKTGAEASITWESLFAAARTKKAIYLYISHNKVFIIPEKSVEGGSQSVWNIIKTSLPADKLFEKR